VAVAFVSEVAIAGLNDRYRESDVSTDVLAFDYSNGTHWPGEQGAAGVTGELVVCPEVVMRYATEEDRDPARQLGWTLIHGALHLAGYDHETDRGEMRAREQRLLGQFDPIVRLLSTKDGRE
jgi:probable rRNA maturation factor